MGWGVGVLVEAKAVLLATLYANCWPINGEVYDIRGGTYLIGTFPNGVGIVPKAPEM